MSAGPEPEETVRHLLEVLSTRDIERLEPLLAEDIEMRTGRGVHKGRDAVLSWARKGYDHLDRRYVSERLEPLGCGFLVHGRTEYVWRETGEVGDVTPVYLAIELDGTRLRRLEVWDGEQEARAALDI